MTLRINKIGLVAFTGMSLSAITFAAGYEKANLWSGRYQGIAGAAASNVEGSESLFFNPAGLVGGETVDLSLNDSATWVKSSAPVANSPLTLTTAAPSVNSQTGIRLPGALTAKYSVTPDLALGVGFFSVGGLGANYGGVDFSSLVTGATYQPTTSSNVLINQFTLGVGYRLMPGLNVGASWAMSMVKAQFQVGALALNPANGASVVEGINIHDLSATNWAAFRLGAQYAPENTNFGFGLNVRTPITVTPTGSANVTVALAGVNPATTTDSSASVTTTLPLQVDIGGHYKIGSDMLLALQYDFTHYSSDQKLGLTTTAGTGTALPDFTLNWNNMSNFRVGYEYTANEAWTFRAGYVLTTTVTNSGYAQPALFAPGIGNTFILGAGYNFSKMLAVNGAIEYAHDSGTETTSGTPLTSAATQVLSYPGAYADTGYTIHLGVTYKM